MIRKATFATEIFEMATEKETPPPLGTQERRDWAIKRAKQAWDSIIESGGSDCEHTGVISGSE